MLLNFDIIGNYDFTVAQPSRWKPPGRRALATGVTQAHWQVQVVQARAPGGRAQDPGLAPAGDTSKAPPDGAGPSCRPRPGGRRDGGVAHWQPELNVAASHCVITLTP